jgi:hypothetical protein
MNFIREWLRSTQELKRQLSNPPSHLVLSAMTESGKLTEEDIGKLLQELCTLGEVTTRLSMHDDEVRLTLSIHPK